jgi:hypothetical protein
MSKKLFTEEEKQQILDCAQEVFKKHLDIQGLIEYSCGHPNERESFDMLEKSLIESEQKLLLKIKSFFKLEDLDS